MESGLTKNRIFAELAKSPHGKLEEYVPVGRQAAGRCTAFSHLVRNCKALKDDVREALMAKFFELNPPPVEQNQRAIVPISAEEKQRRIDAGADVRAKRAAAA